MILLIDNYDSFTYNLYHILCAHTDEVQVHRNDALTIDEIRALSPQAIVLSPGPGHPDSAGICVDLVKQLSGQVPILGICLGHQAIAVAFNSQIIGCDPIVHGKSSYVFHHRKQLFKNLSLPFKAGRYHSLSVETHSLSPELRITAQTAEGAIMALQHKQHLTFGLQFHPESILTKDGKTLINNFINNIHSSEHRNVH